ncbi:YfhE family protein [Sporosarcina sp.]|nr:YfhE family protein [Sporosarcina sp.]
MSENKQPHKTLTDKNNGLSSTQEVLYAKDFKKADKATEQDSSQNPNK